MTECLQIGARAAGISGAGTHMGRIIAFLTRNFGLNRVTPRTTA